MKHTFEFTCRCAGVILDLFTILELGQRRPSIAHFSWIKLWLAFWISNALLPVCAACTWLKPDVVWSGVRYHKKDGRIVKVLHPPH